MHGIPPDPISPTYPSSTNDGQDGAPSAEWTLAATSQDEARRLLEDVQQLTSRIRVNRRKAQSIDRKASAYASRLARHTARLLLHMPNSVPAIKPVRGAGASSLHHYVLRHQTLEAPSRLRLLVVSSDGRLRVCTVLTGGPGSRMWDDYEVADPPLGLGLSCVFEGLTMLIAQLEGGVNFAEDQTSRHGEAVEGFIANSEAVLASAGSRLAPVEAESDILDFESEAALGEDAIDQDDAGADHEDGLTSHGFEHRISFATMGQKKTQ